MQFLKDLGFNYTFRTSNTLNPIFKLNVKDRLAKTVLTLSLAQCGVSVDQEKSIGAFWANFDEFMSNFLMLEQDNAELELHKFMKDQMLATMKKNQEILKSRKDLWSDLTKEEEELNSKLEEDEEFQAKLEEVKRRREGQPRLGDSDG